MSIPNVTDSKNAHWIQVQGEQQRRIADALEAILVELRQMNERQARKG